MKKNEKGCTIWSKAFLVHTNRLMIAASIIIFIIAFSGRIHCQNLLCDHSFDSTVNIGGYFPFSGCWVDNHIYQAGAVVDGLHYTNAPFSLHVYTGTSVNDTMSRPDHTSVNVTTGYSCHGEAKIWTPAGFAWQAGSSARVRLSFLNSGNQIIANYDSPTYTNANTTPTIYSVNASAPAGATKVIFSIFLAKPHISGQSIINVDECVLTQSQSASKFMVQPPKLGFGAFNDTIFIRMDNSGGGTINYQVQPATVSWLTIPQTTGTLIAGGHKYIKVTLNRSLLPNIPCNRLFSQIRIAYNTSDTAKLPVSVSTTCGVPNAPSFVTVSGKQLMVEKRLPCGELSPPRPFTITGFSWSPASTETSGSYTSRRQAFKRWAAYDLGMIKATNASAIYTFLDFGLMVSTYKSILDSIYENGLMAIVTVDVDGNYDTANMRSVVNAYKNHPAILMWALGNEWNINLYHNHFTTVQASALATETAAQIIHSLDPIHPVVSIYGDISISGQSPNTSTIVNSLCPSVDIWGLNIYRGMEFYDLFTSWASITTKPMFISEYGIDSFHTTSWNPLPPVGYTNEEEQMTWNHSLWIDIKPELSAKFPSKQCLGGTLFSWCDEWWKVSPSGIQNTGGFVTYWNYGAFPDSFANEEFFGAVKIDSNIRTTKLTYGKFIWDFKDSLSASFMTCDSIACALENYEFSFYDLSGGTPSSWYWSFGDGTTSSLPNPKHIYQVAGIYSVSLTVYDSIYSSTLTKTSYIQVDTAEMLSVTIICEGPVCQGDTATFIATPSNPSLSLQYQWLVNGIDQNCNSDTFQSTTLFNGDAVVCILTATGYCISNNPAMSNTLNAVIYQIPDTPVITQSGDILISDAPYGNQWYYNGTMLTGDTLPTLFPGQNGNYWVIVTLNGCSSLPSNIINYIIDGMPQYSDNLKIYPMPNGGKFTIKWESPVEEVFSLKIFNSLGKPIFESTEFMMKGETFKELDIQNIPSGIYVLTMQNTNTRLIRKIVIEH
jgi:PKD repeat protein